MAHENVLCIEPSLSEIATYTLWLMVVLDLNYDCLEEIKYHCPHIIGRVDMNFIS